MNKARVNMRRHLNIMPITVQCCASMSHEKVALIPLQLMFKIIVKVKVENSTATFNISVFSVVSFLIKMR